MKRQRILAAQLRVEEQREVPEHVLAPQSRTENAFNVLLCEKRRGTR